MDRKIIDYMEQNEDLEGLSSVIRSKKHPEMRIEAIKALAHVKNCKLSQRSIELAILELGGIDKDVQVCAIGLLIQAKDERGEKFRKILQQNLDYALEIGLAETARIQAEFLRIAKSEHDEKWLEAQEKTFVNFYLRVYAEANKKKVDAPTVDGELAALAKQRMEQHVAARTRSEPRVFRKLGAVCG
ncbi:MAG: hypothetical protein WCT31_02175 [Candidatus Micrarchaeia archaeon]